MVAELFAGVGAFKSMLDMAKALKDMNDVALRNAAVIELQGQILSAQEAQASLVERVRSLEREVASFEKWDTEKEKYELKNIAFGSLAYVLKPETRGPAPPHWICPNCFTDKKISIIQFKDRGPDTGNFCPACRTKFSFRISLDSWGDAE
jgi:hypothetical protein